MRYPASPLIRIVSLLILSFHALNAVPMIGQEPSKDIGSEVQFTVQTTDGRSQYQVGEIIPLKLSFASSAPKKYQINMASYDRSGRMNYEQFRVQPETGWSDPLHTYFSSGFFSGGGLTNFQLLSQKPFVLLLDLNEWVRFDHPGKYRLSIVSNRVAAAGPGSFPGWGSDSPVTSNELQLTVTAASKLWQKNMVMKAASALDAWARSGSNASSIADEPEAAIRAVRTLRFLGTPEAIREMAHRLGDDSNTGFEFMLGLTGSPSPELALHELRSVLEDPDRPVTWNLLHSIVVLMRNPDESSEEMFKSDQKNDEVVRQEALNALSHKHGKALALSLVTVVESSQQGKSGLDSAGKTLGAQVAAVFDLLPMGKQQELLEYRWDLIKDPAFLPILRKYAQQYKDSPVPKEMNGHDFHLSGTALQRWYQMDPETARAAVLAEITRPHLRYSAQILSILPDQSLPGVDQLLAQHFIAQEDSNGADVFASLIQRYGTEAIFDQLLPVVSKNIGSWACSIQSPMLAYLLRVNAEVAQPLIQAAIAARGEEHTACNRTLLTDVATLHFDPALEETALRSLDDDDPEVAGDAAKFLGKYGSSSAEPLLWEHLVRWSERWRGHEAELQYIPGESNPNSQQANLGSSLVLALARGQAWLADEAKLQRLRQLAVGKSMQEEIDNFASGWGQPRFLRYNQVEDKPHFEVVQYEADSLSSFEQKLEQFPAGSVFEWPAVRRDKKSEKIFAELTEFLNSHDMTLKRE